jgi:hypothetical protein
LGRLEEIEKRAKAATRGPWIHSRLGFNILTGDSMHSICQFDGRMEMEQQIANCSFIANSIDDVAWLITEVKRLTSDNYQLQELYNNTKQKEKATQTELIYYHSVHLVSTKDQDWDISDDSGHCYKVFLISADGFESRIKPTNIDRIVNVHIGDSPIEYFPSPKEENTFLERYLNNRMNMK